MGVLLAGFADEAAKGLCEQIQIHKQFQIPSLEIRMVDDVSIGQMNDSQFEDMYRIVQEVDSPALRVIFDTGNPVGHGGNTEDVWEFYRAAQPWLCHFHIKDCYRNDQNEVIHCYPGEGLGDIKNIIKDLLDTGYKGYFSMEPHMAVQIHVSSEHPEELNVRQIYEEYCRRTIALTEDLTYKTNSE